MDWQVLPTRIRTLIEERCGSRVVEALSQPSGFTPGFASVLRCTDGSRHFVKAASVSDQAFVADAYREEARKLALLPAATPAPRLLWSHDGDDWVVLGIEHVHARTPSRPWTGPDLELTMGTLDRVARVLTPVPSGLDLRTFGAEFAGWPALWERLPHVARRDELKELAGRFAEVTTGDTVVHTDVRDDNVLICADGRVLLCDWNWPVVGADWLDSLLMLIGPRGDGLDVDAVIASNVRLRQVPAEHVDIVLALIAPYFLTQAAEPVLSSSPFLREVQRWQGEVVLDWLYERRARRA